MIDIIREIQAKLSEITKLLKKAPSKQINQISIIRFIKKVIDIYFRDAREIFIDKNISSDITNSVDSLMHKLLDATHKSTLKEKYILMISELKKEFIMLEKYVLLSPVEIKSDLGSSIDSQIIDTLKKMIPSAAMSYKQALVDIKETKRFSWRGPATDLRETLRECLDHLAPDKNVVSQPNFQLEKDMTGPTMKQKALYILSKRGATKNAIKPIEDSIKIIEDALSSFVRSVYTRASISTHTPTDRSEILRIYSFVRLVLSEILGIL